MCMVETAPYNNLSCAVCTQCDDMNVAVLTAQHTSCSLQDKTINQNCLSVIGNTSSSASFSLLSFLTQGFYSFIPNLYGRGMVYMPQAVGENDWIIIVNLYLTGEMLQVSFISTLSSEW